MSNKELSDSHANEHVYRRLLVVSSQASAVLAKLPGLDPDEKIFGLTERAAELEHALEQIVRAFDAPHRVNLTQAVVRARELLSKQ